MTAQQKTPIADLVASLLDSGTPGDVIVRAVAAAEIASRQRKLSSTDDSFAARRGSRLPADWCPSQADVEFARLKGMHPVRVETEAERFRNYWTAKSGSAAVKMDWAAVWRNWVLRSLQPRYPDNHHATTARRNGVTAALDGYIERFDEQAAGANRPVREAAPRMFPDR